MATLFKDINIALPALEEECVLQALRQWPEKIDFYRDHSPEMFKGRK